MNADINQSGVILAQATAPSASDAQPVLLVPMPAPLVDANHTGTIDPTGQTNTTSATQPFTFWINDGVDGVGHEPPVQDALDPNASGNVPNNQQNKVTCERDLENFARLWLNLGAMSQFINTSTSPITVGLEWQSTTGTPAINLYAAAPKAGSTTVTGGTDYLTDFPSATNQYLNYGIPVGTVSASQPFYFPVGTFAGITTANPEAYFLFEGTSRGGGQLMLTFNTGTPGNYTKIGEAPALYLNLVEIKELYERWTVGDGPAPGISTSGGGGPPASVATISTDRLPAGVTGASWTTASPNPQQSNYILFVHGWNLHPWEKDAFAETAFKRLYWQGYQGRFGTFQWPTTYHTFSVAALFDFDPSDFSAWQSATPLQNLLGQLNTLYAGHVYLFAHSHGNVVAGEALRLAAQAGGTVVADYVATQAAMPVHLYDPSQKLPDGFFDTWRSPPGEPLVQVFPVGPQTPNVYIDAGNGTSNGWLAANRAAIAGSRSNFYNPNDYAFSRGIWETDQALKPDFVFPEAYYYSDFDLDTLADLFKTALAADPITAEAIVDAHSALIHSSLHLGDATNANTDGINRYEIMAFAAEARCRSLGTTAPTTTGWSAQDLRAPPGGVGVWPADTFDQTNGPYSAHPWHSAEFRFTNMEQGNYWNTLLGAFHLLNNNQ